MSAEDGRDPQAALEAHDAFDRVDDGFVVTTTPFDARVRVRSADWAIEFLIEVQVPSLNAVVVGETVAPVVRRGWFETFQRRLQDVGGVVRNTYRPPTIERDRPAASVVIETRIEATDPAQGVEDAKAFVDFVEGTYVQGLIPGYDYREPAVHLLDRARGHHG